MSIASFGILGDLLPKARLGSVDQTVASSFPGVSSPYPSAAESTMSEKVVSRSMYSLPTITDSEAGIVDNEGAL